jgi:DNA-binding MarR family transcriptional regulator
MMEKGKALEQTALQLNHSAIHLLRGLHVVDRETGITPARLSALSVLVFGGPRTVGNLARAEQVAGPTISRIVDGLVELGLAAREPHPDSARMTLVTATPAGTDLMKKARQRRIEVIAAALARMPEADRQAITAAADALARLPTKISA